MSLFISPGKSPFIMNKSVGFTLIELVITIVLIAIIAGMLAPFIKTSIDGFVDTRIRAELTAKGQLLLDRLSREIREADPDPTKLIITGSNRLQFTQLQNLSAIQNIGGNIIKTYDKCRSVILYQSGNSLLWDEGADGTADSTLSDSVSSISFSYSPGISIRSGTVSVDLTLNEDTESIQLYREIHILNTLGNQSICP